jgi:predicted signal transduction protein with EAL and GGDEF domain
MKLDRTLKVSDMLTSLTIIVSAIALIISWGKDRDIREREQANQVRNAAGQTLAKLERWQSLQLSIFDELQPEFVETSEMLAKDYDIIGTRDHLWKSINAQRATIKTKVVSEQIEIAYIDLFTRLPAIRELFLSSLNDAKLEQEKNVGSFLTATQKDVMDLEGKKDIYTSAMLGNALRATASDHRVSLETTTNKILEPIRRCLFDVVSTSDWKIVHGTTGLSCPTPSTVRSSH